MELSRRARVFLRAHRNGQSLIELLVALAIGVVFILAAVSIIAPALTANKNAGNAQTIAALSQEFSDNVRVWAGGNWNNVLSLATTSAHTYYLNTATSPFGAAAGSQTVTVGSSTFNRYFYVTDFYRDTNGNVTTTVSGNNYDPSTKVITVVCGPVLSSSSTVGSWSTTTPLPKGNYAMGGVINNGYLYVVGGADVSDSALCHTRCRYHLMSL